ncbi:regulatory protein RecX [Clostridium sp. MD294]|uniref:regulatory protein RecX n=1 Tax=Clostridium sp. MD294 TaxID=97138 RepID=UPI0002CB192D|nr:regulatory protein RecX [Clostridium sp. MD294]USF29045.1 Regulatory protein RecX [Clostridium sp. MD294]
MLKITAITQQLHHPERYSVFVNDSFAFGLPMEDITYFKLKEGEEITQSKYDFIKNELIYVKAQDTALYYIGYKMRTEKEVRVKLLEKGFTEDIIERVINFLIEYHYVDDEKYCESYIKQRLRCNPKGSYVLKMELKQRGIKDSIICRVIEQSNIDEFSDAVKLLEKKCFYLEEIDEKEKKRLISFLQRRGYSYDIIKESFEYVVKNKCKGEL